MEHTVLVVLKLLLYIYDHLQIISIILNYIIVKQEVPNSEVEVLEDLVD